MDDLDLGATLRGFIPGQKLFRRYTLTRLIGRGGMGVVWLARDEELERDTALKFLPEVVANDRASVEDLKREVRRAMDLAHPHIVKIHDFVTDGHTAAVSMEYVAGDTLSSLRVDEPGQVFAPEKLAPWVEQLCGALDYAHGSARVVHRDLKPANLMVNKRGELKVLDFGIAASLSESVTRVSAQAGSSGTPVYMSPQQMMGEDPAVTDDIYALGATLYELLTGKPPFYSGNVVLQVQSKVPPPIAERRAALGVTVAGGADPGIPPAWEETIAACLAKEPSARPQSAGEIWQRLNRVGHKKSQESQKPDPAGRAAGRAAASRAPGSETNASEPKSASTWRPGDRPPYLKLALSIAAALVLLGVAGWWFGVEQPARRAAEAERSGVEVRPLQGAQDEEEDQALRKFTVPELKMEMMPIPAGVFMMGSPSDEIDREDNEGPQTKVTISRPFWIGRTEVTVGQWRQFVAATGYQTEAEKGDGMVILKADSIEKPADKNWSNYDDKQTDEHPVVGISWNDAKRFTEWLTQREQSQGRLPDGYVYTLPTEAQWEYACRAGTQGKYAGDLESMGWYEENSNGVIHKVGQKQPNAWGLHDMHGNALEWCGDWSGNYTGIDETDPVGPLAVAERSARGGFYGMYAAGTRSAARGVLVMDSRLNFLGFRVALSADPSQERVLEVGNAAASSNQGSPSLDFGLVHSIPDLNLSLAPIPAGSFQMGSENGKSNEKPVTDVAISHPFWMGVTEVTQAQWRIVMGTTLYDRRGKKGVSPIGAEGEHYPMYNISWSDSMDFCSRLTKREREAGRLPEGYVYSLPTEAQWEYACRAGTTGDYSGNLDEMTWYDRSSGRSMKQVGMKSANEWGLHDMHGNVWEWCLDWYQDSYIGGKVTDPAGPASGSYRVMRGGSWGDYASYCRSSSRVGFEADYRSDIVGLRIVLVSSH